MVINAQHQVRIDRLVLLIRRSLIVGILLRYHQRPPGRRLKVALLADELTPEMADVKPCQPKAGFPFGAVGIRSAL
jgi:hypothetical protein